MQASILISKTINRHFKLLMAYNELGIAYCPWSRKKFTVNRKIFHRGKMINNVRKDVLPNFWAIRQNENKRNIIETV